MPIIIQQAKTALDLDLILALRAQTSNYLDRLDMYPDTIHLYALQNGKVIGALRVVKYRPEEAELNRVFDFREAYAGLKKSTALIDLLVLDNKVKNPKVLLRALLKGVIHHCLQKHFIAAFLNFPQKQNSWIQSLGFLPIAESFYSSLLEDQMTPHVIDLLEADKKMVANVVDKEILESRPIFNIALFEPGELLVRQGKNGSAAYLIEEGQVEVVISKEDQVVPVAQLKEGQLIGELAMLTREARTASIVAQNDVTCFYIDRHEFLQFLVQDPFRSLNFFKICSKRLESANKRLVSGGKKQ